MKKNILYMENKEKISFYLSAINSSVVENMPKPIERELPGKDFLKWGEDNHFCDFLYELYSEAPTVQTIINGTVDFVLGNKVETSISTIEDIEQEMGMLATDYMIFGGCAMAVYRNKLGKPFKIGWLDFRKIRSNKDNTVFYYSEDWNRSYGRVKSIVIPKYMEESNEAVSIIYIKNPQSRNTYPLCLWSSAIRSAKVQTEISKFHLNEICNNFTASAVINFNNGVPTDKDKEDIEELVEAKFTGSDNAGRFLLSFNSNKDNATTIDRLDADDFDKRYENLEKSTREEIFTAFRAIPALFGTMTATTGFNSQEFSESFKLYNRTRVKPIQKILKNNFEKVFGKNTISFKAFSLESNEE